MLHFEFRLNKSTAKSLLVFALLCSCIFIQAHSYTPASTPPSENTIDSLRAIYGHNKLFISDIEKAAIVALSYFPDLKYVSIEFKIRKIKTTMAARPNFSSIFRSKKNRSYLISINKSDDGMGLVFLKTLPFDAQVGVIAHELCHVQEYTHLSFLGITEFGFSYLTLNGRRKTENRTDEAVIECGLGVALSRYCYCVEHCNCLPKQYLAYKQKYYYSFLTIQQLTKIWEDAHLKN